ncbi:pre-mod-mdg4--T, partial [Drosophila busckii]
IPPRKRGRPKTKIPDGLPKLKLVEKLREATKNTEASKPVVYASTTKGGVKLVYMGHLFKFSFRKDNFSVFQCCFREHGDQCKVRVVCDQKNVFPFDGEHIHFMSAIDKSVTSSQFMPGGEGVVIAPKVEPKNEEAEMLKNTDSDEETELIEIQELEEADAAEAADAASAEEDGEVTAETVISRDDVDPNDFREKIKQRLQRALQNKKK